MLNPLIAEDFNAGRGAMSGRLSVRESAMNVLHFLGHLLISTFGVGVAAAVLTYAVVLPLHLFFPSLGPRTAGWILTETPYFPVQIVIGLLWGFEIGRRYPLKRGDLFERSKVASGLQSLRELYGTQGFLDWTAVP